MEIFVKECNQRKTTNSDIFANAYDVAYFHWHCEIPRLVSTYSVGIAGPNNYCQIREPVPILIVFEWVDAIFYCCCKGIIEEGVHVFIIIVWFWHHHPLWNAFFTVGWPVFAIRGYLVKIEEASLSL